MAQRTSNGRALRRAYVASTALVAISIRTADRPTVLHLAASVALLRERIARLLTLAIETPASLLARLNPVRVRKVRPTSRIGRRRWLQAARALAAAAGLIGAPALAVAPAAAQSMTYNYSGSTTTYTTPFTGVFTITAYGAQGGRDSIGNAGGGGASASGIFSLTANELLTVAVGGTAATPANGGGGGGGGSFVVGPATTPLMIAGGGGGAGFNSNNPGTGLTTTAGGAGSAQNGYSGGAGGTNGGGGDVGTGPQRGGGGGGFTGSGTSSTNSNGGGFGGASYAAGLAGGIGGEFGSNGGFGGGGGGSLDGGGGGGGYSGGGGGGGASGGGSSGGGGGSYVDASARNATLTAGSQIGNGLVVISASNITGAGTIYLASNLDVTFNPRFEGGTFRLDQAGATYAQNFTLTNATTNTIDLAGNSATFSGIISNTVVGTPGNIVIANSGTGGAVTLTGANTYTGATTITGGTLSLAHNGGNTIANTSGVVFNNTAGPAALQTAANETIGTLSGGNSTPGTLSTVNIAAGTTLTVSGDGTTSSYAGAINAIGTGVLAKIGTGTQTLTGAMTGGALVANQGTLAIGTGGSLNTAGVPGLVPGATGGQAQAAVLVNTGAIFGNAGTITATNQGVALQGGTFNNTGGVTAANQSGVFALTGAVAITNTGTGSINGANGIDANLTTADAISITGNGSVTGTGGFGIRAGSLGGNVTLGTAGAALGTVTGTTNGIIATTSGGGTIDIVTGGNVTGGTTDAISATTTGTGAATVTIAGANATIRGASTGTAQNNLHGAGVRVVTNTGAGTINVTGSGNTVTGDQPAMLIQTTNANAAIAVTGTGNTFTGTSGLITDQQGAGAFTSTIAVGANNTVTSTGADATDPYQGNAILTGNQGTGTTSVTTGAGTTITGSNGVLLAQTNAGNASAATVSVDGATTGNGVVTVTVPAAYQGLFTNAASTNGNNVPQGVGVAAYNAGSGLLTVTGAGNVVGVNTGILARAAGTGGLTVTGTGATTGNGGLNGLNGNYAIDAQITNAGSTAALTVDRSGAVTGAFGGILARTAGGGNVSVTTGGTITGAGAQAILASVDGGGAGNVSVTTATGTAVRSGGNTSAIVAQVTGGGSGTATIINVAAVDHTMGTGNPAGVSALRSVSNGSGTVSVSNTGAISGQPAGGGFGAFQVGITALSTGTGNVLVTNGGTIGAGIASTTAGIVARINNAASAGTITVDGAGTINSNSIAGYGVFATTNSTGNVVVGGTTPLGAIAAAGTGATGLGATITNVNSAGNVAVTSAGLITAGGSGIAASTTGTGTVTVSAGAITTANGSGVVATGTTGAVAVTANDAITAGSTGGATNAGIFLTGNNAANAVTVGADGAVTQPVVQGAIGLRVAGTGTTTLTNYGTIATSAAAGPTANALQIDGGTLVIGNTAGTLTGNLAIVNAAANGGNGPSVLTVNRTADLTLANTVTGAGTLSKNGTGLLTLTGANSDTAGQFTGTFNVNQGLVSVNGAFGNTGTITAANPAPNVNVASGATLGGNGTIAGNVTVNGGGTLTPGVINAGRTPTIGTLNVGGNLTLAGSSNSVFDLNTPGTIGGASNDLVTVGGALAVNAGAALTLRNAQLSGVYQLYAVSGTIGGTAGNFAPADITTTAGTTASTYLAPVGNGLTANQINARVSLVSPNGAVQNVQFWDGGDFGGANGPPQQTAATTPGGTGGTGTWNATNTNWATDATTGRINDSWQSQVGVFGGGAGTVTLVGQQNLQGLQFTTSGYQLVQGAGGSLNLTGNPFVGGGLQNYSYIVTDAGVTATIAAPITGNAGIGLRKLGSGTLALTGTSTFPGTTLIDAGTLQVGTTGVINGTAAVVNNAAFQILAGGQVTTQTVTNNGALATAGTLTATTSIANNGSFTVSGGTVTTPTLINAAAAMLNQSGGTINATALTNNGTFTQAAGTLNTATTVNGGSFTSAGAVNATTSLTNNATLSQTGGTITAGTFTNAQTGTFTQIGGALATTTTVNNGSFTSAGPVSASNAFTNNGALAATGTITTPTFVNTGTVNGLLTLAGVSQITNTAGAFIRDGVSVHTLAAGGRLDNAGTIGSGGLVINVASGTLVANNTSGRTFNGYVSSAAGTTATFNNTATGRWTYQGVGNLAGTDTINNAGLFEVTAVGGTLNGLELFNNQTGGQVLLNASLAGPIGTFNNAGTVGIPAGGGFNGLLGAGTFNNLASGTITLQNGQTTDRLALGGNYVGTAGSRLAIDIDLSRSDPGMRADVLAINGSNNGSSLLSLNRINPNLRFFSAPIPVVQTAGGGTGRLAIDPATPLPTTGFIGYTLQQTPGSAGSYQIVSQINPGQAAASVSSISSLITSLNVGFFQSISAFISGPAEHKICTEELRNAKLCDQPASTSSVGVTSSGKSWAQLNQQAAAAPVAADANVSGILPDTYGLGLWARGSGGETTIRSTSTATAGGLSLQGENRTRIGFAGMQFGGDFAVFNIRDSGFNLHMGATGGEIYANGRELLSSQASGSFDVPFVGAYAAVTSGAFTSDIAYRHDFYNARITDPTSGVMQQRLSIGSDTVAGSAGYRIDLPGLFGGEQAYFLEPSGSMSYTQTRIGVLGVTGGALSFQPIDSILGRFGVRAGTTFVAGDKLAVQPFVTLSVWNEFAGNAASRFTAASIATDPNAFVPILTNRVGTFGQVGLGITGQILGTDLLGYVRGDLRFGDRIDGYSVNGGVRYPF